MISLRRFAYLLAYCSFGVVCFVSFIEYSSVTVKRNLVNDIPFITTIQNIRKEPKSILDNATILQNGTVILGETKLDCMINNITLKNITKVLLNASRKEIQELPDTVEPKNWARNGYKSALRDSQRIRHCAECAIVTSSGHLLGSKAGPEIDGTECVIRMNAAPTGKYSIDVGKKTTFRIIGHRNFPRMFDKEAERQYYFVETSTKSEVVVTAWLYAVNVNLNIETILSKKYAKRYRHVQFYLTTQEQMLRNEKLFYHMLGINKPRKQLWMSTGWTTMIFALEVCDDIHVYGMTYEEYCIEHPQDRTYYHYFDKVRRACDYFNVSENKITTGHKFLTEKISFALWASKYNITFHYPSWGPYIIHSDANWESPYHRSYLKHQSSIHKNKVKTPVVVSNKTEIVKSPAKQPEVGQQEDQQQEQHVDQPQDQPQDEQLDHQQPQQVDSQQVDSQQADSQHVDSQQEDEQEEDEQEKDQQQQDQQDQQQS